MSNNLFTQSRDTISTNDEVTEIITLLNSEDWLVRAITLYEMSQVDMPNSFFSPTKAKLLDDPDIRGTLSELLRAENESIRQRGSMPEYVDGEFVGERYGDYYYHLICTVAAFQDTGNIGLCIELIDICTARLVAEHLARLGDVVVQPLLQAAGDGNKPSALYYLKVLLKKDNEENVIDGASREVIKKALIEMIENNSSGSGIAVQSLGLFPDDPDVITYLERLATTHPMSITRTTKDGKSVTIYPFREEAHRQLEKMGVH
jgi:hypothetical protein